MTASCHKEMEKKDMMFLNTALILVIATRITNEEAWALGSHCITSQISDEKAQVVKKSIAELVIKHKQK